MQEEKEIRNREKSEIEKGAERREKTEIEIKEEAVKGEKIKEEAVKEEKIEINRLWILFQSKEEIISFVDLCQDFDDAIDVRADKKRTDAKSVMGMLLLNIGEPIEIEYSCYDSEDNFLEFKEAIMSQYQVKEKKQDFK